MTARDLADLLADLDARVRIFEQRLGEFSERLKTAEAKAEAARRRVILIEARNPPDDGK